MWQNASLPLQIEADNTASVTGKEKNQTSGWSRLHSVGRFVWVFSEQPFTCYLCFSCFCFSFSGSPSLGCWWTGAWTHSRVRLLQASKTNAHITHEDICKGKTVPAGGHGGRPGIGGGRNKRVEYLIWSLVALLCCAVVQACNEWIPCSIFRRYSLFSFLPSFLPSSLPSFLPSSPQPGQWCHLELE